MSLPLSYYNATDYLRDALTFLSQYRWIYNYQNTHILVKNAFSHFPDEWIEYFKNLSNDELNKLPVNCLQNCPTTLQELLNKIATLTPDLKREDFPKDDYKFSHNCGISDKKRHEIVFLAPLIHMICNKLETSLIIDVGSGLGYLSHLLNTQYGYKVIGIECSKQYVDMAFKTQEKYYPLSKNEVVFKEHYINTESSEMIASFVQETFNSTELNSSIVGLHACADLSVTILDIFSELDFIKNLVIMPCCYHRLKLENTLDEQEYFCNFPLSKYMKDVFKTFEAAKFLRRPFLRLACQQTIGNFINMSKEDHENHSKNLMFRCILQDVAENENCDVKRLKRKSHNKHSIDSDDDFEIYLNNLQNTHRLINLNSSCKQTYIDDLFLEKMREKWKESRPKCYLIEVLTGLQAAIQSICENVILLDRIEYLREKGFQCKVQKVTDDVLSPRCHAIIASKH